MKKILFSVMIYMFSLTLVSENVKLPYMVNVKSAQMGAIAVPSDIEYLYYNENNMMSQQSSYNIVIESINGVFTYTYTTNGEIETCTQYSNGKIYMMSKYTYVDGKCSVLENLGYDGQTGAEYIADRTEYTYDGEKLTKEKKYIWDFATSELLWGYDTEYKTFNSDGKPLTVERIEIPWGETEKKITTKWTYTYNVNGDLESSLHQVDQEGTFVDYEKKLYTYTTNNKIQNIDVYTMYDMTKIYRKFVYTYDSEGLLTKEETKEESYDKPGTYELKGEREYIYAENYATVNAPTILTGEFKDGSVNLVWTAPANTAELKGYSLFMNGTKYGETLPVTTTTAKIEGLVVGEYFFMVQAMYDEIGSNTSHIVSVTVEDMNCAPPTELKLMNELVFDEKTENTPVAISWTAPTTPYTVLSYNVYMNDLTVGNVTETSFSNALFSSGSYVYSVVAVYAEGNSIKSETLSISIKTKFKVTLASNAPTWGTIQGEGWYYDGDEVTINAIPGENYIFEKWTEKLDGDGGYKDVSTLPEYKFTPIRNSFFSATFKKTKAVDDVDMSGTKIYAIGNNIKIESPNTISKIEVIDISGRLIKTVQNHETIKIDNSGIYIIRVTCGSSSISKKVIVK